MRDEAAVRLKQRLHEELLQRQEERQSHNEAAGGGGDGGAGARADLVPAAVEREVERVAQALESVGRTKLAAIFRACFVSTLETTTLLMPNGHTHVFTGFVLLLLLRVCVVCRVLTDTSVLVVVREQETFRRCGCATRQRR